MEGLVALLVNACAGAGIALLWESWWKPRRERRSLMAALAAEVHHNITYMDIHLDIGERDNSQVPPDFRVTTTLYSALASRLGELPARTVGQLVPLYRQLDELNRIRPIFESLVARHRTTNSAASQLLIGEEITLCTTNFYSMLASIQAYAKLVLPMLGGPPPSLSSDDRMRQMQLAVDAHTRNLRIRAAGTEREVP